jgi:hypothetical protein
MDNYLRDLEKRLGDVTFTGGETIPPADVAEVAARASAADGLLLVWLSGHGGDYETLEKLSFGVDKPAVSQSRGPVAVCRGDADADEAAQTPKAAHMVPIEHRPVR